jgi:PAS domain S-box-containing protein
MRERSISNIFKKNIFDSREMAFLADDTHPFIIFCANELFESQIGEGLNDRSLVGLDLDIDSNIHKEKFILTQQGIEYEFRLEPSEESASNNFLFYKGTPLKPNNQLLPKEVQQLFKSSLDLIAVGKRDYLSYINEAAIPILGYHPEELQNISLCGYVHTKDIERLKKDLENCKKTSTTILSKFRIKTNSGSWAHLECTFQFAEDSFFMIGRDVTKRNHNKIIQDHINNLKSELVESTNEDSWGFHLDELYVILEISDARVLRVSEKILLNKVGSETEKIVVDTLLSCVKDLSDRKEFEFHIIDEKGISKSFCGQVERAKTNKSEFVGIIWEVSKAPNLEKRNLLFEELIRNSPNAIIIVRQDGEILISSEEAKSLFGFGNGSTLTHLNQLETLFHQGESWKEWITISEDQEYVQRFSTLLISQSGKQLTLEITSNVNHIESEKFISISFHNISEKVTLERTLEANNDFLMNLTEQVPGGLYQLVLDQDGKMRFSFLSKGIGAVLGLSEEELSSFTDISVAIARVHPMDLPNVIMSSVASGKRQEPWLCQFRVKPNPDINEYRWILGAARPQQLEHGNMIWYGYLTDISYQKEFETKLDEARLAAEKANQIKSDFLSMISHELRTPLNAISGSTYSLLQEDPNTSQKSALNTINFAVENLIIMINDLLDFQKIEAGKLTIENNPLNLEEFLYQIERGLSFHGKDSKNKLTFHLSKDLGINVKGDKTRLSQVMNNLITNALKFTSEGNVDVSVVLTEEKADKVKVYFEVKDNGIGIARENQQKIFNDFDQVKPSFSTKYGGTGLGLSITRKLLNLMGSTINVESQIGVGSKFYFELVFERHNQTTSYLDYDQPNLSNPPILHLLMAEDNDVNALVLGKIINKWGFTYDRVHNGEEAIAKFKTDKYDCVLMDIQMPVMDGFDATIGIKQLADVPVIALTAAAKLEIMERIHECGFDGFVSKPIDAAELLKKIKEVISIEPQRS